MSSDIRDMGRRFFEVGAVFVVLGLVLAIMSVAAWIAAPGFLPLVLGVGAFATFFFGVGMMVSGWGLA